MVNLQRPSHCSICHFIQGTKRGWGIRYGGDKPITWARSQAHSVMDPPSEENVNPRQEGLHPSGDVAARVHVVPCRPPLYECGAPVHSGFIFGACAPVLFPQEAPEKGRLSRRGSG